MSIYNVKIPSFSCFLVRVSYLKSFFTVFLTIKYKKYYYNPVLRYSNYLQDRTQATTFNSHSSSYLSVTCGVPQGSILGPLFFLIYINDIIHASNYFSYVLFADDTSIFLSDSNFNTLIRTFNKEIKNVSTWLKINKLSLNINKTNYIHFSNNIKTNNHTHYIYIDNVLIKPVEYTQFLGVIIDSKLTVFSGVQVEPSEQKLDREIGGSTYTPSIRFSGKKLRPKKIAQYYHLSSTSSTNDTRTHWIFF